MRGWVKAQTEVQDNDYDDGEYDGDAGDTFICDGCGQEDGQCPLCCGSSYAPGSEECDFCEYSDECADFMYKLTTGRIK